MYNRTNVLCSISFYRSVEHLNSLHGSLGNLVNVSVIFFLFKYIRIHAKLPLCTVKKKELNGSNNMLYFSREIKIFEPFSAIHHSKTQYSHIKAAVRDEQKKSL